MTKSSSRRPFLPLLIVTLLGGAAAPARARAEQPPRFTVAQLFFELNDTDEDLGLHAVLDGAPWTDLEIETPDDRLLFAVAGHGTLRRQGLTQLSFESAEPPFDELDPEEFFERFAEGRYEFEARAQGGSTMAATALLSHVLAAPPENILVSGVQAAESCDAESLPMVGAPVFIDWDPVTESHPEVGKTGTIRVSRYQLFVEGGAVSLAVDLPPDTTEFEIPASVTRLGTVFKFEIIVRTTSGNNTAVESCFRMF
jgi:hypothetical protein